jgi:predicted HAD superfamily phosphohydrolase YqeG
VIDRIEASVGAIDRAVEGKKMRTSEQPLERSFEQILESAKAATRQTVDVGDQLNLIIHGSGR